MTRDESQIIHASVEVWFHNVSSRSKTYHPIERADARCFGLLREAERAGEVDRAAAWEHLGVGVAAEPR